MENEDNIFSSGALPFSSALLPLRLLQMNSAKPTLFFILYSELQEVLGKKTAPVLGLWGLIEFVLEWLLFCSVVVGSYA